MLLALRNSILTEEFDYGMLKHALRAYKNPRVKINDLLKKGHIVRVKKGLYIFGPGLARGPYSREVLANLIYGPSYISLEYALSFYGLIPERVETVTSITNKRKKIFDTPAGLFSYSYIHPSLYPLGIMLEKLDEQRSILIACREKAVADMLYFSKPMTGQSQLEQYLFNDLRIDSKEVSRLNLRRVKELARVYGANVRLLSRVLEGLK